MEHINGYDEYIDDFKSVALWLVLLASVSFGVYKNFTAIDIHTVHEKEVIEQRIVDTNRIENFVKGFAKS